MHLLSLYSWIRSWPHLTPIFHQCRSLSCCINLLLSTLWPVFSLLPTFSHSGFAVALRFSFKCFAKTLITHLGQLTTTQRGNTVATKAMAAPTTTTAEHNDNRKMRLFHWLLMSFNVVVHCRCCCAAMSVQEMKRSREWESEKIQHETNFSYGI